MLDGGVGQNAMHTDGVARVVHRYRDDIIIAVSELGDEAAAEGLLS